MKIRLINEDDDRNEISHVYAESWKSAYKGLIPQTYLDSIKDDHWAQVLDSNGWNNLILLNDQGKIIGTSAYCTARAPKMKNFGEIISIYLLPEYFGKGYGKCLLQSAIDWLKSMRLNKIYLWVLEDNFRARHFYEKFGFKLGNMYLDDNIAGEKVKEIQYVNLMK